MLPSTVDNDSTTDKVDYNLSDKHRIFALFTTGKYNWPTVGSLTPVSTSTLPTPYTDGRERDRVLDRGADSRFLRDHHRPWLTRSAYL